MCMKKVIRDALSSPQESIPHRVDRSLNIIHQSGAEGTRTPDLLRAKEALSQLSYSPICQKYYTNKRSYSQFAPKRLRRQKGGIAEWR